MVSDYDIAIIGGGAAGLSVAAGAAQLGAKTILISNPPLGGDCLHYGCIPSKALIHAANLAFQARRAREFGLGIELDPPSFPQVLRYVRKTIQTIEPHDSPERFRALGVEVLIDQGRFLSPHAFKVGNRTVTARYFVLATGSRPAVPPIEGLDNTPFLTNETLFSLEEPVSHLLVLGGGPIGCEMAQALRRLGSHVTLISMDTTLLPREDADLSAVLHQQFENEGIRLYLGAKVLQAAATATGVTVQIETQQGRLHLEGSHLLLATGRVANLEDLGLEAAGVALRDHHLVLNDRLRTTNSRIYACGDVAGPFLFTHMAEHQAGVVLKNTLFHWPAKVERQTIPWCTFTDPELARVGVSETEAKRQRLRFQVFRFPFSGIDRAVTMSATQGFAKVIATPKGKILGAAIVGPEAGELIHEYVLAMRAGLKLADLSNTIHIYPTLSQINRRLADQRLKAALTPTRKRWLQRLFGLRGR